MSVLQSLLPDLLEVIASFLDQASLAAMICTCRRINSVCIPALYKDIVVDDWRWWYLYRCVEKHPELAAHVQGITFDHGEYFADHYADNILPMLPRVQHLRFFAQEQGFFGRGADEDENALGLGLWWPGPRERIPSSVRVAASNIGSWLPALKTCKSFFCVAAFACHTQFGKRILCVGSRGNQSRYHV